MAATVLRLEAAGQEVSAVADTVADLVELQLKVHRSAKQGTSY